MAQDTKSLSFYERKYKKYENCTDGFILPDMYVVVRVDGHRLDKYTWETFPDDKYPLSQELTSALLETTRFIFCAETNISYSFTHGDEISVLLAPNGRSNERKRTRLGSSISSAAACGFYQAFLKPMLFHAKISELPTHDHVINYFMWQRKVAERNFISRKLGIALRDEKLDAKQINAVLQRPKEELLALMKTKGLLTDQTPSHERFGTAHLWQHNSEQQKHPTLVRCKDLPESDDVYEQFLTSATLSPSHRIDDGGQNIVLKQLRFEQLSSLLQPKPVTKQSSSTISLSAPANSDSGSIQKPPQKRKKRPRNRNRKPKSNLQFKDSSK